MAEMALESKEQQLVSLYGRLPKEKKQAALDFLFDSRLPKSRRLRKSKI